MPSRPDPEYRVPKIGSTERDPTSSFEEFTLRTSERAAYVAYAGERDRKAAEGRSTHLTAITREFRGVTIREFMLQPNNPRATVSIQSIGH
jgi:hypothetical protein